ncbi:MAG: hypothetical protein MUD01_01220 [Chloroflexaceae bacterium]|jgi:hypothetical protein|nr:hypothetical protein [Chloroflexaceae bacterium]
MHNDTSARLHSLAAEYVELVEAMRNGQYADEKEWRTLSSQRSLVHDELIALTGIAECKLM